MKTSGHSSINYGQVIGNKHLDEIEANSLVSHFYLYVKLLCKPSLEVKLRNVLHYVRPAR